jgi:DNA-directed RNA polymerase subunit RPC12/RpoP
MAEALLSGAEKKNAFQEKGATPKSPHIQGAFMIHYFCPTCERVLQSGDDLAGLSIRCPHCRSSVEVPKQSDPKSLAARTAEASRPTSNAETEVTRTPGALGRCDFCDEAPAVHVAYLIVSRSYIYYYVFFAFVRVRHWAFQCVCCDACYRKGRWARTFPFLMAGVLFFPCLLLAPAVMLLNWVGAQREQASWLWEWGFMLWPALFPALYVYTRLHIRGLLGRSLFNELRDRLSLGSWWLPFRQLYIAARPPRGRATPALRSAGRGLSAW